MCAIVASFDKKKLEELYKLNAYRGELSYSLSAFQYDEEEVRNLSLDQGLGKIPDSLISELADGSYYITHTQAPTTEANNIHPSVYGDCYLWHNGIIKQKSLSPGTWDTQWLQEQILNYGWSSLSRIDGTFACLMYNGNSLFVFRNEISPMYYDADLNFSSTKFDGSLYLPPNVVHKINLEFKVLEPVAYFDTFENPYYIPETT
jgi:hypothetical protein